MADITLVIGNKNYSSWSLRAWLAIQATDVKFNQLRIPLDQHDSRRRILEQSPAGKVPVLHVGGLIVHESLAIAELLAERYPAARLWPAATTDRAEARAISAEMHAGFPALREALPMNCRGRFPGRPISPAAADDIARITDIWRACRARSRDAGDFLFGHFTIADAMYAPVVSRFQTYSIALDDNAAAYCATVHALPAMRQWFDDAAAEAEVIASAEFT